MHISWDNRTYGSFPVANIFVSDYMKELSGDAVKLYIFLIYLANLGRDITEEGIVSGALLSNEKFKAALGELIKYGLLETDLGNIVLLDLGTEYASSKYGLGAPKNASRVAPLGMYIDDDKDFRDAVKIVNDTHFSGMMTSTWFNYISDTLKSRFDPEVIVMLFDYCASYTNGKMSKPYVSKVADAWAANDIRTVEQLKDYLEVTDRRKRYEDHVKAGLSRPLILGEKKIVYRWLEEYGYDESVVDILLNSLYFSKPTIGAFEAQMSKWHEAGLKNRDEILRYEEEMKEERKAKASDTAKAGESQKKDDGKRPSIRGNFEQRKYDDDFLNGLMGGSGEGDK